MVEAVFAVAFGACARVGPQSEIEKQGSGVRQHYGYMRRAGPSAFDLVHRCTCTVLDGRSVRSDMFDANRRQSGWLCLHTQWLWWCWWRHGEHALAPVTEHFRALREGANVS